MATSVRERSRNAFRIDLARAAVDVFIDHGFDGITVEELSQTLGISRATFFRYFGSKEDVIVVAVEGSGERYAKAILDAEHPGPTDAWALLREAFEPAAVSADADPDRLRARMRMIGALPALKARIAEKRAAQQAAVATALGARTGDVAGAGVLTAAAYAAVDTAWDRWADDAGAAFREILDEVFTALRGASTPVPLRPSPEQPEPPAPSGDPG